VTGGACGGGGSNYTGSWTGNCSITPSCGTGGTGMLTNVATVSAGNEAAIYQNARSAATITLTAAPITIWGTKYNDATGKGFGCGEAGQGGVAIDLYKQSSGQTGPSGAPYLTAVTAANGNYSFTGLAAGTYYVQEVVPSGWIQTGGGPNGSAGNTYYTINASTGQVYGGDNFADYQIPTCSPTNVSFTLTPSCGSPSTVSDLRGNTKEGETVTATFTVPAGTSEQITLVSYNAPTPTFNSSNAYQQTIYQQASGTFGPGTHTLTVKIPNNDYQIDFACGAAISELGAPTYNGNPYGPDSSNIFYSAQSRLISADNGGTVANASLSDAGLAYTPAQIRTAYGINALSLDGTGQTIAIVDAYDDPSIYQAMDAYDNQFGLTSSGATLYQKYGPASSFLTVLNQQGQTTFLPTTDPAGAGVANWELEAELDVEWAHAIAPGAKIVLVEANSQSLAELMAGVATAATQPGVSVVSMSWGFTEGQSVFAQDEANYDPVFTTPAGHPGVTFVASTGDYGSADPEYPAFSPNVVAVGGTSLSLNADNSYNSETGWGYFSNSAGTFTGSGGGTSLYEAEPAYQQGVQSTGLRSTPDVSLIADPATGAWVADPYNLPGANPFQIVGGTSLSAPCWAGLFALANQGRAAAGQPTLNSTTPSDAQQALYSLPASNFNSITSGTNGAYSASAGYNMVTGLGTPVANLLVPALVSYQQSGDSYTYVAPSAGQDTTAVAQDTGAAGVPNVFDVLISHMSSTQHGSGSTGSSSGTKAHTDPSSHAKTGGKHVGIKSSHTVSTLKAKKPARLSAHNAALSDWGDDTSDLLMASLAARVAKPSARSK
jgi:hypothetical protein